MKVVSDAFTLDVWACLEALGLKTLVEDLVLRHTCHSQPYMLDILYLSHPHFHSVHNPVTVERIVDDLATGL